MSTSHNSRFNIHKNTRLLDYIKSTVQTLHADIKKLIPCAYLWKQSMFRASEAKLSVSSCILRDWKKGAIGREFRKVTAVIDVSDVWISPCVCVCVLRATSPGTACRDAASAWSPSPCRASPSWRGFVSRTWPSGGCFGIATWAATSPSLNVWKHTQTHVDTHTPTHTLIVPFLIHQVAVPSQAKACHSMSSETHVDQQHGRQCFSFCFFLFFCFICK